MDQRQFPGVGKLGVAGVAGSHDPRFGPVEKARRDAGAPLNDGPSGNWIIEGMSVTNLSGRSL